MIAGRKATTAILRIGGPAGVCARRLLARAGLAVFLLLAASASAAGAAPQALAQALTEDQIDAREDRREALADRRDRRLDAREDRRQALADRRERRREAGADRRERRREAAADRRERRVDARAERRERQVDAPEQARAPRPDPRDVAADPRADRERPVDRGAVPAPPQADAAPAPDRSPSERRAPSDDPAIGFSAGTGEDAAGAGALPRVVGVVPEPLRVALAALAALALALAGGFLLTRARGRRQREHLRREIGLLERALLPAVPARIGALATSVAHTPVEGRAAGGDFYDVFELADGRVGIVVGDMSGHGGEALASTAHVRYMLRAYLDAGLSPRDALNTAGIALADALGDGFATAVVCMYDPAEGTLSYAGAGHPAPLVLGPARHEPVSASSSPPLGLDIPTGLRGTTVSFPPGSLACFFTDGVVEARADGELLGRDGLERLVSPMGSDATAQAVLARVAQEADATRDDMVACVVHAVDGADPPAFRTEELRFGAADLEGGFVHSFLRSLDVPPEELYPAVRVARKVTRGGVPAVVRVRLDGAGPRVDLVDGRSAWPSGVDRPEAAPA